VGGSGTVAGWSSFGGIVVVVAAVRFRYFPTDCLPNFMLLLPQLEVINSTILKII